MFSRILFLVFVAEYLRGTTVLAHGNNGLLFTTSALVQGYNMRTADLLETSLDFREEDVLKRGQPVGRWASCGDGKNATKCFTVSPYQDRLSFQYTIDLNYEMYYVHREPEIQVISPHGATIKPPTANPEVSFFDLQGSVGKFTILFHCRKAARSYDVLLQLKVSITSEKSRTLRFYKACGTGIHPNLHANETSGTVTMPLHFPPKPISVPATASTTQVRLTVQSPTLALAHGKPTLTSSNPDVMATLRGVMHSGTILNGIPLNLMIIYTCRSDGTSFVTLAIPIPPWKDIVAIFKKRCGRRTAHTLEITTHTDRYVVISGHATPKFDPTTGKSDEWDKSRVPFLYRVAANESDTAFTMRNRPLFGETPLYVERIVTSVINSSVVLATVGSRTAFGFKPFETVALAPRKKKQFFLQYTCLRKGYSLVLVTIQTLQHKMVEFGITKYCDGEDRPNYLFASMKRFQWALFAAAVTGVLLLCFAVRRRRKSKVKFEKLDPK